MLQPRSVWPRLAFDNQDNQRASVNTDEADLRTFPVNSLTMASFFGSKQIHEMGENIKALVLSATGKTLSTDLTVSAGHKHLTQWDRLRWLQLCTHLFVNSPLLGDDIEDSVAVNATANTKRAVLRLWVASEDAKHLIPRFRVSVAPAPSATVNISLVLKYYKTDGTLILTAPPLSINTSTALDRVWFEGPPVDLHSLASADPDLTDFLPVIVVLESTMGATTESLYIHEVSFGVYDL